MKAQMSPNTARLVLRNLVDRALEHPTEILTLTADRLQALVVLLTDHSALRETLDRENIAFNAKANTVLALQEYIDRQQQDLDEINVALGPGKDGQLVTNEDRLNRIQELKGAENGL